MSNNIKREDMGNFMFAFAYVSKYRYLKQKLLENEHENLEQILTNHIPEQYENLRQMVEIEMIVNAVQYCSELGAFAICIKKGKINEFMKMLSSLHDADIKTAFYDKIKDADIKLLRAYMGYHELNINKDDEAKYNRSCERYRENVIKLSVFHNMFYGLYCSYKHGLRVVPLRSEKGDRGIWEACEDNTFNLHKTPEMWWIDVIEVTEIIRDIHEKLYLPLVRQKFADFSGFSFTEKNISSKVKSTQPPDLSRLGSFNISFDLPWYIHKPSEQKSFY